jgi:hypothetical protein
MERKRVVVATHLNQHLSGIRTGWSEATHWEHRFSRGSGVSGARPPGRSDRNRTGQLTTQNDLKCVGEIGWVTVTQTDRPWAGADGL